MIRMVRNEVGESDGDVGERMSESVELMMSASWLLARVYFIFFV